MKMMSKIWFWDVLGSWDHWIIQLRLHTSDGAQSERIVLALQAETQRNQYARVLGQHVVDRWLADNRRSVNSRPVRQEVMWLRRVAQVRIFRLRQAAQAARERKALHRNLLRKESFAVPCFDFLCKAVVWRMPQVKLS